MHLPIPFWNKCNNKCVMCTNPVEDQPENDGCFDLVSLDSVIKQEKKRGYAIETIYISGGEPTIRPDFFYSIRFIRNSFPLVQINIISNGRRFFYSDFAQKCLSLGAVNFIIPIHGWDEKSHDAITGTKGSFAQTVGGLKNLLALRQPGQQIEIRVIIHKINYKKVSNIFNFILKEFPSIDRVAAIFIEYEGHAVKNLKLLELTHKKFYPEFKRLKKYLNKFKEIRFYHFPLCVMPKEFWPYMWRTLEKEDIVFPERCNCCAVKENCLGVHKNYFKLFGGKEFNPIKKKIYLRPSFNYYHPIIDVEKTSKN